MLGKPEGTKWRHYLNPCDVDHMPVLTLVGDLLAMLATDCPCCNGGRMVFALLIGALGGAFFL